MEQPKDDYDMSYLEWRAKYMKGIRSQPKPDNPRYDGLTKNIMENLIEKIRLGDDDGEHRPK